jgi:hypothetical protein
MEIVKARKIWGNGEHRKYSEKKRELEAYWRQEHCGVLLD